MMYVGSPFRPCVREWSPPLCSDSQPARVTSLPRASLAVCPPPPPPPVLGTKKPAKQPAIEAPGRAIAPAIARFISRRLPMSGAIALIPRCAGGDISPQELEDFAK